jgi:hypothetical protein
MDADGKRLCFYGKNVKHACEMAVQRWHRCKTFCNVAVQRWHRCKTWLQSTCATVAQMQNMAAMYMCNGGTGAKQVGEGLCNGGTGILRACFVILPFLQRCICLLENDFAVIAQAGDKFGCVCAGCVEGFFKGLKKETTTVKIDFAVASIVHTNCFSIIELRLWLTFFIEFNLYSVQR